MSQFTVIPAIDLKDHHVVRLSQGKMDQETIYSKDPVSMAAKWVEQGATRLHLVDLNGAFAGHPIHFEEIAAISKRFPKLEIEVGGGIRDFETIQKYFQYGVDYCILGTKAVRDPDFLKKAATQFPNKLILGIDAKNGAVSVSGWDEVTGMQATEFIDRFSKIPLNSIIYTDIAKDGMLIGPNFAETQAVAAVSTVPVIASGGLSQLSDIETLKKIPNVMGVIAGKSLYEDKFKLSEAISSAS